MTVDLEGRWLTTVGENPHPENHTVRDPQRKQIPQPRDRKSGPAGRDDRKKEAKRQRGKEAERQRRKETGNLRGKRGCWEWRAGVFYLC